MLKHPVLPLAIAAIYAGFLLTSCAGQASRQTAQSDTVVVTTSVQQLTLPQPYATKSALNFSEVIGWGNNMPLVPAGFTVSKYAAGMKSPRWLYVLPNGDVLVSQANKESSAVAKVGEGIIGASKSGNKGHSPNQLTLLRDANNDGIPEIQEVFLSGLNQPFGMLLIGNKFYVANTDAVWVFPYATGDTKITAAGKKIIDLPAGGRHWTRNIVANKDNTKLYVSVGSSSNVAEDGIDKERRRACILEVNTDGSAERIYASGLRNPVGMDWAPGSNMLWTAVNERDELGDELVPDYMTSVEQDGFYGWPYSYFGQHLDPRIKSKDQRPDLVNRAVIPDVPLGAHTASLGLAFYRQSQFPAKYRNGAFVAQHGSWNRKELSGYKVMFVPFMNGKPSGPAENFLTGFIADPDKSQVYGRPVGLAVLPDGSLLVTDDGANVIWRVSYGK